MLDIAALRNCPHTVRTPKYLTFCPPPAQTSSPLSSLPWHCRCPCTYHPATCVLQLYQVLEHMSGRAHVTTHYDARAPAPAAAAMRPAMYHCAGRKANCTVATTMTPSPMNTVATMVPAAGRDMRWWR